MHGKKLRKIIALFILSSFTVLIFKDAPLVFGKSISESESAKQALKEKSEALKKSLDETKNAIYDETSKKDALDKQIAIVKEQIDNSNKYIFGLEQEIQNREDQLKQLQEDMKKKMASLKSSLRSIYIAGDASTIDIILGAKTFEDFIDKAEMVRTVSTTISNLIDELNKCMEDIEIEKTEIQKNKSEAELENNNLNSNRIELQSLIDESEALIKNLHGEESSVKKELDENDSELQQIEAEIKKYYEEQKRKAEEEKKRQEELKKKQQQQQQQQQQSSSNNTSGTSVSTGAYAWPVPGYYYISSDYFDSENRGSAHGAIDIAGAGIYGAKIVAAADGEVIKSSSGGWGGGYGTYVHIDHGNGRSTLYGHMSSLTVSLGQKVKKGQVIGYVGSTGHSTGPHLHFETRLYGSKYNPMIEFGKK